MVLTLSSDLSTTASLEALEKDLIYNFQSVRQLCIRMIEDCRYEIEYRDSVYDCLDQILGLYSVE